MLYEVITRPPEESLLEFPCDFPIKVMGEAAEDFDALVVVITSYSIHYTKLYDNVAQSVRHLGSASSGVTRVSLSQRLHLDLPLLGGLLILAGMGLTILYSSGGQDIGLVLRQGMRLGIAFIVMFALARNNFV